MLHREINEGTVSRGEEASGKKGIGAPVRRVEDRRFLTGQGHFADDTSLANMAFAYVVRSPHAHAKIVRIDNTAARSAPGVIAVVTGEDIANEKVGELKCLSFPAVKAGEPHHCPSRPILAVGRVR